MNHAPMLAALAFTALGLSSTSASADVGFYLAPGTVAVTVGGPVVYAPPPPVVVYAPPPPTTRVVYVQPAPVVYAAPIAHHRDRYVHDHRTVVAVQQDSCDHRGGPPAWAPAHGHHKNKYKHKNKHHGRR